VSSPSRSEQASRAWERIKTEPGLARNTIVVLALIVIAGVVGGIVLANQRFVAPWDNRQIFYADFEATPGISPGNGQEVRIAGVNVGDITGADVDDHGQARLKMAIERGHKIYENAKLVLRPKSPLNEMYVTIDPGSPPSPEIPQGYTFPRSSTVRPVQIDEVLDHLDDNARSALTSLLSESDVALTSAQTNLPRGLDGLRIVGDDLKPVAQQLALRKQKIRELISALGEIANAVGGDDKRIQTLANGLQTTLHSFGTHEPQFDQSLAQLPGLVANLRRSTDAVQDLSGQLDPTLRNLQHASDAFPKALKDLRGTADKLDDVVDSARPFLDELKPVVAHLRPFADDLHDALPELHQSTRRLDPITHALLPYLPDVGAFTVQTRSIVSMADANGGILRGLALVTPQTLPALLGPNNGLKPLPDPGVDKGESILQRAVPSLTGSGQPSPPQDGSDGGSHPEQTPGEHSGDNGDDSGPAGLVHAPHGGSGGLLPMGNRN
jgi:phospholipid/cholesterol/gamma-HCH transport system substrate-binding protein